MRIAGLTRCTSGSCTIHSWTLDNSSGLVDRPSHNGGKDQAQQPVASRWEMSLGLRVADGTLSSTLVLSSSSSRVTLRGERE
jgi:hypothetical protein